MMIRPATAGGRACPFRGAVGALATVLVSAWLPASAQVGQGRVQSVSIPLPGRPLVVRIADLDGDGRRDLVVAHLLRGVEPPVRCLSVYRQSAAGFAEASPPRWVLDPRAGALFLGDLTAAPGVEIGFLAPDGAYVYEREGEAWSRRPRKIVHLPTFFGTPMASDVADWTGRVDADGNGLDDLFVPTGRGIRLYLQAPGWRFGALVDLPLVPERAPAADLAAALGAGHGAPALFLTSACALPAVADIDGDGRSDILFIQGDRLVTFLQGADGRFPEVPSDAVQVPVLREFARKDRLEISRAQLADVNRDGRADLVVTKRYGNLGDFGSIETLFYFFVSKPPASGDPHPRRFYTLHAPDQQIRLQGFSPQDPEFGDADGDGRPDLLLSQVTTETWGKIIQVGVLREISVYYYLHLFDPSRGRFSPSAAWSRTVAIPTQRIDGRSATWPLAYIRGDVDGDGRIDFVEVSGRGELTAHTGRPMYGILGPDWSFSPDDWFRFELEGRPEAVAVEDLNGDGRVDVVVRLDDRVRVVLSK